MIKSIDSKQGTDKTTFFIYVDSMSENTIQYCARSVEDFRRLLEFMLKDRSQRKIVKLKHIRDVLKK